MTMTTTVFPSADAATQAPAAPSIRVDWAPVPKVNLLPPEILEGRRFRTTQRLLASAVGATLLVSAAAVLLAQQDVSSANSALAVATARTSELKAQAKKYDDVPRVLAQVDAAASARQRALSHDILWYRFLNDLAVATPDDVSLSTMAVQLNDAGAPAAAATDPLTPGGLGTISFTGSAKRFPDVAAWLTSVGTVHGMDASRLQSASRADATDAKGSPTVTVSFSTKVVITSDALSHRYDRKAG